MLEATIGRPAGRGFLVGWTLLATGLATGLARADGPARGPVAVLQLPRADDAPEAGKKVSRGMQARELVRQAVLIAARDEMGLATRDATIGELDGAEGRPPAASVRLVPGAIRIEVRRPGDGGAPVWTKDVPLPPPAEINYADLVVALEVMSREDLPAALVKAGFARPARKVPKGAGLPAGAEENLLTMTFWAQFAAVRSVHEAIRADGETGGRLGALARGYANLGILTEHHASPAHEAFKARAILYARRYLVGGPGRATGADKALGYWHAAYAWALAGYDSDASASLGQRGKMRDLKEPGGETGPPPWVDVIEPSLRYDHEALSRAAGDARIRPLALFLRAYRVADPSVPAMSLRAAREAIGGGDVESLRLVEVMGSVGGVSNLHLSTELGLQVMGEALPARLAALDGLPPQVAAALRGEGGEAAFVAALIRAGGPEQDAGEPSWEALGRMVREARFVTLWRRLAFMRNIWAVPTGEFLDAARELAADHPLADVLELYGPPGDGPRAAAERLAASSPSWVGDASLAALTPLVNELAKFDLPRARALVPRMLDNGDLNVRDLKAALGMVTDPNKPAILSHLARTSPDSPTAAAADLATSPRDLPEDQPDWQRRFGRQPLVLAAAARRCMARGRREEAERYLDSYIALSPDRWAFRMLADGYKRQGRIDDWRKVLEDYLARGDDPGLEHARVRQEIAYDYMNRGDFARAMPYAEAAAETWAQWAMMTASECAEGLGDLDRAARWQAQAAGRYDSAIPGWFFFVMRTHRGDLARAKAAMDAYLAAQARVGRVDPWMVAWAAGLTDDPKRAAAALRPLFEAKPTAGLGLMVASFADEAGDRDLRDRVLREAQDAPGRETDLGWVIALIREALAKGEDFPIDLAAYEAKATKLPDGDPEGQQVVRADLDYRVGTFLALHGRGREAVPFLRRAADSRFILGPIRGMAARAMRKQGIEPYPPGNGRDKS